MSPLVLTVGKVTSGTRWNVISGSAKIEGTVRSLDSESRDMAEESVKRIAANTAASYRCTAEVKYDRLCDNVYNLTWKSPRSDAKPRRQSSGLTLFPIRPPQWAAKTSASTAAR